MRIQIFSMIDGKPVNHEVSTTAAVEDIVIRKLDLDDDPLDDDPLEYSVGDTVVWSLCRGNQQSYSVMDAEDMVVTEVVRRSRVGEMPCVDIILKIKRS